MRKVDDMLERVMKPIDWISKSYFRLGILLYINMVYVIVFYSYL